MKALVPPSMPEEQQQELVRREGERGRELIEQGSLRRIWRIPGRWENVSLYSATDATELHQLISSLPMWPWLDVQVEPLAIHPLEARTERA